VPIPAITQTAGSGTGDGPAAAEAVGEFGRGLISAITRYSYPMRLAGPDSVRISAVSATDKETAGDDGLRMI
jgi:hypothetical protein